MMEKTVSLTDEDVKTVLDGLNALLTNERRAKELTTSPEVAAAIDEQLLRIHCIMDKIVLSTKQ